MELVCCSSCSSWQTWRKWAQCGTNSSTESHHNWTAQQHFCVCSLKECPLAQWSVCCWICLWYYFLLRWRQPVCIVGLSNTKLRDLVLVLDKRTTGQIFAGGVVEDDCESVTYCGHRPMERTWYLGTRSLVLFFQCLWSTDNESVCMVFVRNFLPMIGDSEVFAASIGC